MLLPILFASAFFTVNAPMPPWAFAVSNASILLFAAPSFFAARRWIGTRGAVVLFGILGLFALAIETAAIATGIPYGNFAYSEMLGFKLFGLTPWTILFAWTPLMIAAYAVARIYFENWIIRTAAVASILVGFDLVLDPGAVSLRFWSFQNGGWFYSVPVSNFVGWLISGAVGALILETFLYYLKPLLPVPVQLIQSAFLILIFWVSIAFWSALWMPFFVGILLLIVLAVIYSRHIYRFDEMIVLVNEKNEPIGTAEKLSNHHDKTPLHRAFSIFLFSGEGKMLLQKRASHKKTWGGIWSNSCCGHLMLHESLENAAKRRVKYELGIKKIEPIVILPDFRYRAEKDGIVENEICPVMAAFIDSEPRPNAAEVEDFEWIEWKSFVDEIAKPDDRYSPWAKLETEELEKSELFQKWLSGVVKKGGI